MLSYLITGGTGLIGIALIRKLSERPCQIIVLTRNRKAASSRLGSVIRVVEALTEIASDEKIDYVINLAGEPIADKRWSEKQKSKLWQSRVELTSQLVDWMALLDSPPRVMVSGSAVGWYGDGQAELLSEKSQPHQEYTYELCDAWEKAALKVTRLKTSVVIIRTGLVISGSGGFLGRLKLPFKLGLGAQLGDGNQYMSWIHINDVVNAIHFLLSVGRSDKSHIYNLTSPGPVTNREFTQTLARVLGRKAFLKAPAILLKRILGEMSRLLLTGQRVIPENLLVAGFQFEYSSLDKALRNVLKEEQD